MKKYFLMKKEVLTYSGLPVEAHTSYQICFGTPGDYEIQGEGSSFSQVSDRVMELNKTYELETAQEQIKELKALVRTMSGYLQSYSDHEQHIPTLNTVNDLIRRGQKLLRE